MGEQFDSAGLPQRLRTASGDLQLAWNAAGQLRQVSDTNGKTIATYTYDAQGRRASKTTAQGSAFYLYEGTQLIATATYGDHEQTRITGQYLYQGYRPVACLKPEQDKGLWHKLLAWINWNDATAYALATDRRGAVLAVTTLEADPARRKTLWQSRINAWGAVPANAERSAFDPGLRLVNQYADAETGLSYNLARYYDPAAGRYLSPDPTGIADSIDSQTPDSLKLDITVYAAGQPYLYFDPDAAAKITYYAITTGAQGQLLGTTQGFTKARWAFEITGIQAGGDASTTLGQLRNQYAQNGTSLLFDGGGNFVSGFNVIDSIKTPDGQSIRWDAGSSDNVTQSFRTYYVNNLISISQFTINNADDNNATNLIRYLSSTQQDRAMCKASAPGWLPPIPFSPEDLPINVADTKLPQRILNCGNIDLTATDATSLRDRMIAKLSQSLTINEVNSIYLNCNTNGCPSAAGIYLGGVTGFANRTSAAYSPLQFSPVILEELVRNVLANPAGQTSIGMTAADVQTLQLDQPAVITALQTAAAHARWTYVYADCMNARRFGYAAAYSLSCPASSTLSKSWSQLTLTEQTAFTNVTGLGPSAWTFMRKNATGTLVSGTDYVRGTNAQELLDSLAWASWNTEAQAQTWFISLVRSSGPTGNFQVLSTMYLKYLYSQVINRMGYSNATLYPLANGGTAAQQQAIDLEMAARVARRQNGGNYYASIATLKANDPNNYVKKTYGDPGFVNLGNFPAMRCAGDVQLNEVPGLKMTPLQLN